MTQPTATELARRALITALRWGGFVSAAIAVIGGVIGWFVAEWSGVWGALIGSGVGFVFLGFTAVSILLGFKISGGSLVSGAFFGVVLGGWLLKFALFLVVAFAINDSTVVDEKVAFVSLIAAVIGALTSDVLAINRARIPVVDMLG
ncbi:MAG: hypothetical protein RIS25_729 [Actinomycetota bacterium]|jgi:hypothetical protein